MISRAERKERGGCDEVGVLRGRVGGCVVGCLHGCTGGGGGGGGGGGVAQEAFWNMAGATLHDLSR